MGKNKTKSGVFKNETEVERELFNMMLPPAFVTSEKYNQVAYSKVTQAYNRRNKAGV